VCLRQTKHTQPFEYDKVRNTDLVTLELKAGTLSVRNLHSDQVARAGGTLSVCNLRSGQVAQVEIPTGDSSDLALKRTFFGWGKGQHNVKKFKTLVLANRNLIYRTDGNGVDSRSIRRSIRRDSTDRDIVIEITLNVTS